VDDFPIDHEDRPNLRAYEAEVAGTDEIRFWVMRWGMKAEVLEPQSLREEIKAEAEVMAEKYTKPSEPEEESARA
jgi:predicted DNA-binding transcriptional regulator YafY